MSVSTPAAILSEEKFGFGYGRGDVENRVIETLRIWTVTYLADFERKNGLVPRALPVPPTPESIHGGIDFETWSAELVPEIIVVVQPTGEIERHDPGYYGQWFSIVLGAIVHVEGDQDQTRALADAYGQALQLLVPQQGSLGRNPDGSLFATRTRLSSAYGLAFVDETVRDIVRASLSAETFVARLVSDMEGPDVPPRDPYAVPGPPTTATKVEVALIRGTPDTSGPVEADAVVVDGTVVPTVIQHEELTVDEPVDDVP